MLSFFDHPDQVVEIRLDRPPVNALNPALVRALSAALQEKTADGARALVLSGRPGLFSAGLDVPELLGLDEAGMREFWRDFFALLQQIATSPVPIVTALTGHSPAGGTVLALYADYRIQAEGDFRLGLNEVQVGLVIPPVIHQALVRLIGPYAAERHLVAGDMIPATKALEIGLIDEIVPADQVVEKAVAWCRRHLALPQRAMHATRALCRADLADSFKAAGALDVDGFVRGWFSDETQGTMRGLVERLKKAG
ncbi:MAG: enoyl-CoA hydratase/isomerase family protein [Wenzhouxiangella sp.]